jgi:hypothetical protein
MLAADTQAYPSRACVSTIRSFVAAKTALTETHGSGREVASCGVSKDVFQRLVVVDEALVHTSRSPHGRGLYRFAYSPPPGVMEGASRTTPVINESQCMLRFAMSTTVFAATTNSEITLGACQLHTSDPSRALSARTSAMYTAMTSGPAEARRQYGVHAWDHVSFSAAYLGQID